MNTTATAYAEPSEITTAHRPTLLVLDSEAGIRRFLLRFFTPRGYRVLVAASHEEAALLLREETIACLLLELRHEAEDVRLLRALRALDPHRRIRTVVSALYISDAIDHDLRQLGVQDYLPRPWDVWDLEATVARVLVTPTHHPRWMDARGEAERYVIWLREPHSEEFRVANASRTAAALATTVFSADDPLIHWLARHPEQGVLTHDDNLATSQLQTWDLEFIVGLYQQGELFGVVGLKDRVWRAWYEAAKVSIGFTISPKRLWVTEIQTFAAERLEDNEADLLLKLATILTDPVREHAVALITQTLPTVQTFADKTALATLQAQVRMSLAHYRTHGYLYAASREGPWPMALVAVWDAYQTLLNEGSTTTEAISEIEALGGLFLAPHAVSHFVRTLRRFPALLQPVHRE